MMSYFSLLGLLLSALASCHALIQIQPSTLSLPSSLSRRTSPTGYRNNGAAATPSSVSITAVSSLSRTRSSTLYSTINDDDDDEEEHLTGIGVGIDLGTTNSALAMMIPASNGDRYVPTMIHDD